MEPEEGRPRSEVEAEVSGMIEARPGKGGRAERCPVGVRKRAMDRRGESL